MEITSVRATRLHGAMEAAIQQHIERCTVPLVLEEGDDHGLGGAGTLLTVQGRSFLVTASHVAKSFIAGKLGIPVGRISGRTSAVWVPGHGQPAFTDESREDVAVLRLDDASFVERISADRYRHFLTPENVWQSVDPPPGYVLYGYPLLGARIEDGDLVGRATMIETTEYEGTDVIEGVPPRRPFDLLLDAAGCTSGQLKGISGCAVWGIRGGDGSAVWSPAKALGLCAVETGVLSGRWIRSTRWEVVTKLVQSLLP